MIHNILIVCEGNICRSPMAQGLLASLLPCKSVVSAGLGALVGRSAHPTAIALMAERGIDIRRHVATALNVNHIRVAEVVLVMTQFQQKSIETNYTFAKGRIFRIGEHDGFDVNDPYRKDQAAFEKSLLQIERGAARWIKVMTRLGS